MELEKYWPGSVWFTLTPAERPPCSRSRRRALNWSLRVLCSAAVAAPLTAQGTPQVPVIRPKPPVTQPVTPPVGDSTADPASSPDDNPPPGDWAPAMLDAILSSSNPAAAESLYDAAFAAGANLIPQLQLALKDDRTAEFAAQCLALDGGTQAMEILQTLVSDPRDLDLRRFYLGALGEYRDPAVTQLLLNAVAKSDQEPDRTVTEAAIWALTVRSDAALASQLRESETRIVDVVIRDDVDNAAQVIEARARYLASPEGRGAGASIDRAVRTYFIAALGREAASHQPAATAAPEGAKAEMRHLIFNPDRTRALAHVTFDDRAASENYDMVLQKQLGDWNVVSIWVGAEVEKAQPATTPQKAGPHAAKKPVSPSGGKPSQ